MVRKRIRASGTRRTYRKTYESDDNESESDLDIESPPISPAPKRYGLRQRKQPIIFDELDYDEEDELNENKPRSDDEEYNVEVDLIEAKENHITHTHKNSLKTSRSPSVSISKVEVEDMPMEGGLIDFEDVIRADVVLNKQKVDYDHVINKTEIPVEIVAQPAPPVKEKGRRGRKPKAKPQTTRLRVIKSKPPYEGSSSSMIENSLDEDTNFEVQIDPLNFVLCESEELSFAKTNGASSDSYVSSKATVPTENGSSDIRLDADIIEKYVPPELDEKEKEVVLSNEYLLGNSFDMSADEFLEKQAQKQNELEHEEETVPIINFEEAESSDDDVVIIEKKPEIIVLDDD